VLISKWRTGRKNKEEGNKFFGSTGLIRHGSETHPSSNDFGLLRLEFEPCFDE